ncbi:uncharacterized protein LOC108027277 isoform X2 [Drosophila biarmipes]|uniref:uncharacterized protein LOC108027277 isoform X2 n=1 Tax=Drosophila biarmipes TaxID=125945 RepID=UPI0021CCD54B|nr:uncharacterized protein LOC108027277 isoform X2 [Drosophila biarmipes]
MNCRAMRKRTGILVALCLCLFVESLALLPHESEVINKCILSYGGLNPETAERLGRFKDWAEGYEEIPCFTQCYLAEMFDFYNSSTGFDMDAVVRAFGEPVYTACQRKLELPFGSGLSSCQHAYEGFHCITNAENHPFTVIDNMANISLSAKTAMKECLQNVDQAKWKRFAAYGEYPVIEPIPCYTRCFLDKLHLFDQQTRLWKVGAMRQHLGVPARGASIRSCHLQRGKDRCATYYKQFTCHALALA